MFLDDEAAHVTVDAVEKKFIEASEGVAIARLEPAQEFRIPLLLGRGLSFRRALNVQIDGIRLLVRLVTENLSVERGCGAVDPEQEERAAAGQAQNTRSRVERSRSAVERARTRMP